MSETADVWIVVHTSAVFDKQIISWGGLINVTKNVVIIDLRIVICYYI